MARLSFAFAAALLSACMSANAPEERRLGASAAPRAGPASEFLDAPAEPFDCLDAPAELPTPTAEACPQALAVEDPEPSEPEPGDGGEDAETADTPVNSWSYYRDRYDTDGDEHITRAEYTRSEYAFTNLDVNRDGILTGADFAKRWDGRRRDGEKPGAYFVEGGPREGDLAPALRLSTTTGDEITLDQFRGKKPVVLVFGSFT